jgi:hypothetical protein
MSSCLSSKKEANNELKDIPNFEIIKTTVLQQQVSLISSRIVFSHSTAELKGHVNYILTFGLT